MTAAEPDIQRQVPLSQQAEPIPGNRDGHFSVQKSFSHSNPALKGGVLST
jgi:hypothetical protein